MKKKKISLKEIPSKIKSVKELSRQNSELEEEIHDGEAQRFVEFVSSPTTSSTAPSLAQTNEQPQQVSQPQRRETPDNDTIFSYQNQRQQNQSGSYVTSSSTPSGTLTPTRILPEQRIGQDFTQRRNSQLPDSNTERDIFREDKKYEAGETKKKRYAWEV